MKQITEPAKPKQAAPVSETVVAPEKVGPAQAAPPSEKLSDLPPAPLTEPCAVIKKEQVTMEIQLPQLVEEPPKFTTPLRDLSVNDGDRIVELKTHFRGNPNPSITWFFNSKPIQPNQDFQVHVDVQKGETSLVIIEVFPEDEGEYMVKAENRLGAAVTHCKMFVRCK